MSDSLCSIENVLLPSIGSANQDLTFVFLPNRKRILEEIANNIAERKHTFLTVSAFKVYMNLNSYFSKKCVHLSISIRIPDKYGFSFALNLIGIAAGAAAKILPISSPFARGFRTQFGIIQSWFCQKWGKWQGR